MGREIFDLPVAANAVAWCPDGQRLAIGAKDRTVQLWDASPAFVAGEPVRLPSSRLRRQEMARTYYNLGGLLADLRHREKAEIAFRDAIEIQDHLISEFPRVGSYRLDLARTHFSLGRLRDLAGEHGDAAAEYRRAAELEPDDAALLNDLAWFFATCPDPAERDPKTAVRLARRAADLNPHRWEFWNTLGVALYRARDWNASIEALQKSIQQSAGVFSAPPHTRTGGDSFDWFFLAMAHWQRGEKEQAHKWYEQAVQWMDKNQPANEELRRFRAEAAELLGAKDPPAPAQKK
jgi:tetratricopeptide (TPR) repeat protein